MSIVQEKYRTLAPRAEYLHDVVVLAQAWKKAHTYIRHHNWYADALELDCSAIGLEARLTEWASTLEQGSYQTAPAMLVPAPKNAPWAFDPTKSGGWGPVEGLNENFLRPLAHIDIRDQTISTAVMLCLADCIETAQGDPGLKAAAAAAAGVYSYGNRLYCRWTEAPVAAHFAWGNSNTYSRYFQDYQAFVERPSVIAQGLARSAKSAGSVLIVKLDLTAFYDNIHVPSLVRRMQDQYAAFERPLLERLPADDAFWKLAGDALTFAWREKDHSLASLFKSGVLPKGLPQGLVASGFFANAYLIDFDRQVGASSKDLDVTHDGVSFRLHDYCRYVDDLRLVISAKAGLWTVDQISRAVSAWIQEQLDHHTVLPGSDHAPLQVNAKKTSVEPYSDLGGESGIAVRMKSLQQQLSGPFDMATLQQVETGLSGLLALAELGLREGPPPSSERTLPALAFVARTKLEVRDDTLTRFSAYRLTKSLRLRRSMTDLSEGGENGSAKDLLLQDFEAIARRLVAAWANNPSLVQVLLYALDLFPDPALLTTVVDALHQKLLSKDATPYETHVVYYVLAELLRAGAVATGRRSAKDPIFVVGDLEGFRQRLKDLALALLNQPQTPWYVQQQASLLLACLGHPVERRLQEPELRRHSVLHNYLVLANGPSVADADDEVAISLVGYQLRRDAVHHAAWFYGFAARSRKRDIPAALELIGHADLELLRLIVTSIHRDGALWAFHLPRYLGQYLEVQSPKDSQGLPKNEWVSLASVIKHPSSPFGQENSLLQLAKALTQLFVAKKADPAAMTPLAVQLRCSDWDRLADPRVPVPEARTRSGAGGKDPRYATPPWCAPELAWIYAIGRLLRAAATGEPDFTARQWVLREDIGWYHGMSSTWHKRRMGLMNSSTALRGSSAAITPWFSQLLAQMLLWPGVSADDVPSNRIESASTPDDLIRILNDRLQHQQAIYGVSSDLPLYVYPVEWQLRKSRQLRVVIIQGLMPAQEDFKDGLSGLNDPRFRERHRNHTAALLSLAHRKIQARDSVLGKVHKPHVDLVVLPEYAIHVDDQDLMRTFSDATGAMLFYGVIGATKPGTLEPINMARWLVPQRRGGKRSWIEVDQGKWHLTEPEKALDIKQWRPHQVVIELQWPKEPGFKLSGAICYDATDIALAADLRDQSHMFVIPAMNKDVKTFDSMVGALRYHMYQHVVIANAGEFGGSTAQAPYDQEHKRLIAHVHGSFQLAVSVFDIDVDHFGPKLTATGAGSSVTKPQRIGKTPPAGLKRGGP